MKSKWESERENLLKYILEDKLSYEEIGRMYNCTGSNIKKVATRLGIELEVRRVINDCELFTLKKKVHTCLNCAKEFNHILGNTNKYCCTSCELEYKHQLRYNLVLNGDESIMRANYSPSVFRGDIIKEQNGVCAICGCIPEWNNKALVFIVDHIDGKAANNHRSNLRCVCPNCDS